MKLIVAKIPEQGLKFEFMPQQSWVCQMVSQALPNENPLLDQIAGSVRVSRIARFIKIIGSIQLLLKPACHRCLKDFEYPFHVSINMDLVPLDHSKSENVSEVGQESEVELSQDDLNFSFYDGQEIVLEDLISEQIVLLIPPVFLCQEDCLGLCSQCGVDLNQTRCTCVPHKDIDPRLSVLEDIKSKLTD